MRQHDANARDCLTEAHDISDPPTCSAASIKTPGMARLLRPPGLIGESTPIHHSGVDMLGWAIGFFVVAIVAAIFGFGGIAASATGIAKILFFAFLILSIASFVFSRRK